MAKSKNPNWTREQLLPLLRLYCHTPFGRLHGRNPEIVALAAQIGRTPNAVGMQACNFASQDEELKRRGIGGLPNAGQAAKDLWADFMAEPTRIAEEAEAAYERLMASAVGTAADDAEPTMPQGPSEIVRSVRTRRIQSFFRASVLLSYENRCALTGLRVPELLIASHIIPWRSDERQRGNPRNGIALNALHDRAFDLGFISFDETHRVLLSPRLNDYEDAVTMKRWLTSLRRRRLTLPHRFTPDPTALAYHREHVFQSS